MKRRPLSDYQADLRILRRYYTGFEARNGWHLRDMTANNKKVLRAWGAQIQRLKALDQYPHVTVKGKGKKAREAVAEIFPVPPASLQYKVIRTTAKGKRTVTVKKPIPREVPVFVIDPKAKLAVNPDGSIAVEEFGFKRDVYAIDRQAFTQDPYKYMRDFMKAHKAKAVTMSVGGNVIGRVFNENDFIDEAERARRRKRGLPVRPAGTAGFVTMVEKYQEKDRDKAEKFLEGIGTVSVLRGGRRASNSFEKHIQERRAALRKQRQSKRGRLTGRR